MISISDFVAWWNAASHRLKCQADHPELLAAWEAWKAAVAAEREHCARVCDDEARLWEADGKGPATEARLCAARIRAGVPR